MTRCCNPCRPATLLLLFVFIVTLHHNTTPRTTSNLCLHAQPVHATPAVTSLSPSADEKAADADTAERVGDVSDGADGRQDGGQNLRVHSDDHHDTAQPTYDNSVHYGDGVNGEVDVDELDEQFQDAGDEPVYGDEDSEHFVDEYDDDDEDDDTDDNADAFEDEYGEEGFNDDDGMQDEIDEEQEDTKPPQSDPVDEEHAYMAFFESDDLGTDETAIKVRINGKPALDVHLHNSTMLSFRVPAEMLRDRTLFTKAYVDISIGTGPLAHLPLAMLKKAIMRVNVSQFRLQFSKQSMEPSTSADMSTGGSITSGDDDGDDDDDDDGDENASSSSSDSALDERNEALKREKEYADMAALLQKADSLISENTFKATRRALSLLNEAHTAGNTTATTMLATMYLTSRDGQPRNLSLSAELLQNASAKGYPDAQALLAFLHASGFASPIVPVHIGAAILLWTVAAEGGSTLAKMALAYRHYTGTDVVEDCETAVAYYEEVAKEVFDSLMRDPHPESTTPFQGYWFERDPTGKEIRPPRPNTLVRGERNHLSRSGSHRPIGEAREVVQYYRHSADRGDAWAQMVMGTLYYYGEMEIPKDRKRAMLHFERAAKAGRKEAHAIMGFIELRERHISAALKHLRAGVEKQEKLAYHGMGYLTLRGIGVDRNERQAAIYFEKAAEENHPESLYNLAILRAKGVGVQQSPKLAFDLLQRAAKFGHVLSSYKLGVMLRVGLIPAERNCQKAAVFLKRVAQDGMWSKVLWRALRSYERGAYGDALVRYLLAAHAGLDVGQYNAAFLYEHGMVENEVGYGGAWLRGGLRGMANLREMWAGVRRGEDGEGDGEDGMKGDGEIGEDWISSREALTERAMELYLMSGSQGTSEALVRIGDLAFGERRDFKRAARAYERASKERNAEAMFNLGVMHARGFGMTADVHMAKRYFDMAMETDRDAYLPASIALFVLREVEAGRMVWERVKGEALKVWGWVLRMGEVLQGEGEVVRGGEGMGKVEEVMEGVDGWWRRMVEVVGVGDAVAVTVLVGVLAAVVNARQRRMVEGRGEGGGGGDGGGANDDGRDDGRDDGGDGNGEGEGDEGRRDEGEGEGEGDGDGDGDGEGRVGGNDVTEVAGGDEGGYVVAEEGRGVVADDVRGEQRNDGE